MLSLDIKVLNNLEDEKNLLLLAFLACNLPLLTCLTTILLPYLNIEFLSKRGIESVIGILYFNRTLLN